MARSKTATRRGGRELAFQVLYGLSFTPAEDAEALRRAFILSPHNTDMTEDDLGREPEGFAWELVKGVWGNSQALDETIARYSLNWRVDRMGRIELTLLRLAMFEMLWRRDVPPKVAINEALELSEQFGAGKAKNFINGILDAAARAVESGTPADAVGRNDTL